MRQFEDRLGKFLCSALFSEWGGDTVVQVGTDLLPHSFYADVLLIPNGPLPIDVPGAGLLTRYNQDKRCLIEPFSGSVQTERLEGTLTKLRLSLQLQHQDKLGSSRLGALWIVVNYWPFQAMERVFVEEPDELEPGLLCWQYSPRETVYLVHANEIALREETLLFRLLGEGRQRKEAVTKLFSENIEPYITLLERFDLRFKAMTQSNTLQKLDYEELKNLIDLSDTRQEVLIERGRKLALEQSTHTMIQLARMLAKQRFPRMRESTLLPLEGMTMEQLSEFMSHILTFESARELREFLRKL